MPLFKCEWPNGDVSFVLARDVADAMLRLDEFGDAEPAMLTKLSEFLIDLSPNRKVLEENDRARKEGRDEEGFPWQLGELSECLLDPEAGVLPSEEATLRRLRKVQRQTQGEARPSPRVRQTQRPQAKVSDEKRTREGEAALRARAIRDGTLVDLAARRRDAQRRPTLTSPVDEP